MTSSSIGLKAEQAASEYLVRNGYKIVNRNWRNRYCEIDIVASKNKSIYFVEVKYRANDEYGSGLDYITDKKLKQMEFATNMWVNENNYEGNYQLCGIEVSGIEYKKVNLVEIT